MGIFPKHRFHQRAANAKYPRLPPDAEASMLKELIARFSPTLTWTETMTPPDEPSTDTAAITTATTATTAALTTQDSVSAPVPATTSASPPDPFIIPSNLLSAITDTSTTPVDPVLTQSATTPTLPPPDIITTSTSSTSNVVVPPTVVTTPSATVPQVSIVLTTSSQTFSSAAASATPSETSGAGTNVGGIIGGVFGAILGVAVAFIVVRFLINRKRRRDEDDAAAFSPSEFRRSAILMNDPPTHEDTINRGYNPRPPSMIERHMASPAPTFGTQYGAPGPNPDGYNPDQYAQYHAYGPTNARSPSTAVSDYPAYPQQAYPSPAFAYSSQDYAQSPFSPIRSPNTSPYEAVQAAVLTRQNSMPLSRQPSASNNSQDDASQSPHSSKHMSSDYIDLNRSSVTPFQAAQYAEISQQLNTDIPAGLTTPAVNEFVQGTDRDAPPVPDKDKSPSPFSDPVPAALQPGPVVVAINADTRTSIDSVTHSLDAFPTPPSSRADSTPPTLPEIHLDSRPQSYDFPTSVRGSSPASGMPSPVPKEFAKSPLGNQFPSTPSPLASSFGFPTPPPAVTKFSPTPPTQTPARAKRPDTVYDDDDAYGGI